MPIDAIDPKIETLKSFQASKIKQAQDVTEKGAHEHPDEIRKKDEQEKTTVKNTDESKQENVDKDGKREKGDRDQNGNNPEDSGGEDSEGSPHDPLKGNLLDIKG